MTDLWKEDTSSKNDHDNSGDSDDQKEIESYLYSLIHHDSTVSEEVVNRSEECNQLPVAENSISMPAPASRGWRYFNVAPCNRKDSLEEKLKHLSQYHYKNPNRLPFSKAFGDFNRVKRKASVGKKMKISSPASNSNNSSQNHTSVRDEAVILNSVKENDSTKGSHCASTFEPKKTQEIIDSGIVESKMSQVIPTHNQNTESFDHENSTSPAKSVENNSVIERNEDELNNTNISISSIDDNFELPTTSPCLSKPKVTPNLQYCMSQVLGSMLDEDASRSSIESEKRTISKPKEAAKSGNGSSWTVGTPWEEMSSKFSFEVDSVCGESVREGSVSASSRANTPEPADISKYNAALKNNENCLEEIPIEGCPDSDSEVESVVEVAPPEKTPPPLVVIESDSEDVIPAKRVKLDSEKPDKAVPIEEDIVIIYETGQETSNTSRNQFPVITLNNRGDNSATPRKRNERQRKSRQQESVEDRELEDILAGMSDDPNLWHLCVEDIFPRQEKRRAQRCDNCKQLGHLKWRCTEPVKLKVCSMCGGPGHINRHCPESACLHCGSRTKSFINRCSACTRSKCNICNQKGHNDRQCPDLWRRYHCTTTAGPPVPPPKDTSSDNHPSEIWCSNCARKGQCSRGCPMPTSALNDNILTTVISYLDPTKTIPNNQSPRVPRNLNGANQAGASSTSQCTSSPHPPAKATLTAPSTESPQTSSVKGMELVDFSKNPNFIANYRLFSGKLQAPPNHFPKDAHTLASFLESHLRMIKNPVLQKEEVQKSYSKLMSIMTKMNITQGPSKKDQKRRFRNAWKLASELNMTLLGYFRLGPGEHCIGVLNDFVSMLRSSKTRKVSLEIRSDINDKFQAVFKGCIRSDLNSLLMEYWKRENSESKE